MAGITFEKGIELLTLEDCILYHKHGFAVIIDEGSKITFEKDK